MVLTEYFPVLVFILVGIVIGVLPPLLSLWIAPRKPDSRKNAAFECGFDAFENTRMPF